MQVKKKTFSYPFLNNDQRFSSYKDKYFRLCYETDEDDNNYYLNNCYFECNSELINKLYDNKKINVLLIIECSKTIVRISKNITKEPTNIVLPKTDFLSRVDISLFAYALDNFVLKESDEFYEEYNGYEFEIEKYVLLCANDGFNITFRHEENESNLVQSIFSIQVDNNLEEGAYTVSSNDGRKIVITISKKSYQIYRYIYQIPHYKEVFFNMLLIPALIDQLSMCKELVMYQGQDFDDLSNNYPWFNSILKNYKKRNKQEFTEDDLKNLPLVKVSQILLGEPFDTALDSLKNEINSRVGGEEDA